MYLLPPKNKTLLDWDDVSKKYYRGLSYDDVLLKHYLVVIIEALIFCELNNVKYVKYYRLRELACQRLIQFEKIYRREHRKIFIFRTSLPNREFEDIIRDYTRFLRRNEIFLDFTDRKSISESRIYINSIAIKQEIQSYQEYNSEYENRLKICFLPNKYTFLYDSVKIEAKKVRAIFDFVGPISDSARCAVMERLS